MLALRRLLAHASTRSRALLGASAALGVVGRLALVATAIRIARGEAAAATVVGAIVALVYLAQRALQASARVGVECDLHRAAAAALVEGDVLDVPGEDLQRVIFESTHHARGLVSDAAPAFAAEVVAAAAVLPVLAGALPGRVLVLAVVGFAAVVAAVVAVRSVTHGMQRGVLDAYERVADGMLVAVEGRLELVARGGEEAYRRDLDVRLDRYGALARRAGLGAALLGRAPLAAGAAVVFAVVAVDGASREAVVSALLSEALILAACAPIFLGVVLGAHEIARATPLVAPLLGLLSAHRRAEAAGHGAVAAIPGVVRATDVAFAYAEGAPLALEGVTFEWAPGAALVVVGANGAGKSTLLRLLVGLRLPTSGSVRIGDHDLSEIDLVAMRRRAALLPQRPYLGEAYATVRDAFALAAPRASDDDARAALERAGVLDALERRGGDPLAVRVGELSAGQRQRVALARVLAQDAALLLLDEPDANLDREGIARVAAIVTDLVREGRMVAVAAHSAELDVPSALRVELAPARVSDAAS